MKRHIPYLYVVVVALFLAFVATALAVDGVARALDGLWRLQAHPARLLNDFTAAEGAGAALLNASLVALIGLAVVIGNGVALSGPSLAAVFTMFGFGFFGKTPLNIVPIIAGVWIAARVAGRRFREYLLIALFGTAVAPLVVLIAVELPLPAGLGIPISVVAGALAGLALPAVAMAMLRLHQGYSLYNMGLSAGFVALFAAALVFGRGEAPATPPLWNAEPGAVLGLLAPATSLVLVLVGSAAGGRKALSGFARITRLPGRLPSDFMDMESVPAALLNMGIMGLLGSGYVYLVGGDFSGPVLGGLFTVIGFAAFGKHPRNAWPVVAGVVVAAFAFGRPLSDPGVLLAALFVTTLAPLVGSFGVPIGLVAGFLHLAIVMRSGAWHSGIDLYNNGFAGGLTATLVVAVLEWYRANRRDGRPFSQR